MVVSERCDQKPGAAPLSHQKMLAKPQLKKAFRISETYDGCALSKVPAVEKSISPAAFARGSAI